MSFPRYPAYKASGVEWLGAVPEHWEVVRLGFLATKIGSGKTPSGGAEVYRDHGVFFLRSQNVHDVGLQLSDVAYIAPEVDEEMAGSRVQRGDLLLNITGASLGRSCIVPDDFPSANVNQHVCIIRPSDRRNGKFLAWAMNSQGTKANMDHSQNGAAREGLNYSQVSKLHMVVPPREEQEAIAAFLDRETARIDALVAEQERLIELLREKRQAVISHAVTKGLDPNVPMKDSGVEWLGEVPGHWTVIAIKWLSPVKRGASPRPIDDPKYFDDEGEFSWVRIADVSACEGMLTATTQRLSELGSSLSVKIGPGELFVSIAGTVGKPCISAIKACIHDGFVYFPNLQFDNKFLFRIFESGTCYGGLGKWGTQLNLNTDTIGSIRVGVPPDDEMMRILAFIDEETGTLDTHTAEALRAIALLQERRAALISAAVTGRVDVRGELATKARRARREEQGGSGEVEDGVDRQG